MRRLKRQRASRTLAACVALGAAIWLSSCAGTPRRETAPECDPVSLEVASGFSLVLDLQDELADPGLDAFVSYFEELRHFCREVLPAWSG